GEIDDNDYRIHLGANGAAWVVHGSDWNAYVGPSPSPLLSAQTQDIFGAAFSVIIAAAKIFIGNLPTTVGTNTANLLQWNTTVMRDGTTEIEAVSLGDIWFVGAGSVGSAIAYFLVLAGLNFKATIFDRDIVET